MSILTIAYASDVIDGKIVIKNSQDDSVVSDDPTALLDFLARNYTEALNRKVCWNLDRFIAPLLKVLGLAICKELIKEPNCEALFSFGNGKAVIHDLTEKPRRTPGGKLTSLPDSYYNLYYHRKTSFGLQAGSERKSFFYNLSQFFEDDETDIPDPKDILAKANELVSAFFSMGLNPLKMSSPISVYQSNVLDHMDFPTLADLPSSLKEKECDEIAEWSEEIMHREWTTALAVGHWKEGETWDYDVRSSYGYHFSNLYNFKYASFTKSNTAVKDAHWGILKGKITIYPNIKCSPICYDKDGQIINPVGCSWYDKITLPEVRFMYKRKIGEFELDYGYFWQYTAPVQPFKVPMERIFNHRLQGGLVTKLAKRVGASAWAKCIQRNLGDEVNKFYNPIFGLQVKTNARLQVADFIYNNALQDSVLHIGTDGVRGTQYVPIPEKTEMGSWKLNPQDACIILSPGRIHTPTHNPQGLFYQDMVNLIQANPKESYYSKTLTRRMTLGEAVELDDLSKVGEPYEFSTSIDLVAASMSQDLTFKTFPKTGRELLDGKYYGEPKSLKGKE